MLTRRDFLGAVGASALGAGAFSADPGPRKKLAVVTTEWRDRSHAWHMAERFLAGYPIKGKWHRPAIDVVAAYVDQFPKSDLSRDRARESGFTIYKSVAEALRCGTDKLAVDAVLIIGEHGDYPDNEFGQKKYPRYEFFKQVAEVFKKDGRAVPVFNDKHLLFSKTQDYKALKPQEHEMRKPKKTAFRRIALDESDTLAYAKSDWLRTTRQKPCLPAVFQRFSMVGRVLSFRP